MQWELSLFRLAEATTPGVGSPIQIPSRLSHSNHRVGSPIQIPSRLSHSNHRVGSPIQIPSRVPTQPSFPLRTKGTLPHPWHLGPLVIWLHRAPWRRCAVGCSPVPHSNLQSWDTPAGVLSESHWSSAMARLTLTKLPSAGISPSSFLSLNSTSFAGYHH